MLKHVVWWTLKEEAEGKSAAENATALVALLKNLEGRIPSLLSLDVSAAMASTTTEACDVILVSTHEDEAGLEAYAKHPEHVACLGFVKRL